MFSINIRGTVYTARTLAGISAAYCKARDESGEGASTFPFPDIVGTDDETGKETIVARLSYNGRIWPNIEYDRRIVPLYDPAADPVPDILDALRLMVELFDHCGLFGLIVKAKRHGWTKADADERMAACSVAKAAIAKAESALT